jgi:glycerate dehydrogenase
MSDTETCVFLDTGSLDINDLDWSQLEGTNIRLMRYVATNAEETASRIQDANIVITNKVIISEDILKHAPVLQLICIAATGTNNVDIEACKHRGITVCNARGYATPSVVQHVFALILSLSNHLVEYRDAVQGGGWYRSEQFCLLEYPISELHGKTLGIVGYGVLGQAVGRLGEAFGMRILIANRPGQEKLLAGRVSMKTLLTDSDVISLHCPLAENTRNLIGPAAFRQMKPSAILVNTSRGGIVDEEALLTALDVGAIAGAGIDVLATEPPLASSPLLTRSLPNLLVTPHIAWSSQESRQRLLNQIADNIAAFLAGTPRNIVT